MTSSRGSTIGFTIPIVLLVAALYSPLASLIAERRVVNAGRSAVVRTLAAVVPEDAATVAIMSESAEVDGFVLAAGAADRRRSIAIVRRDPAAVNVAASGGLLLAGQRGRAYLEALGYQLSWLATSGASPPFPWARVRSRLGCAAVRGDAWSALPGVEFTGRLGIVLPPSLGGSLVMVIGDSIPLRSEVEPLDDLHLRIRRQSIGFHADLPPDFWLEGGTPREAPPHVEQVTIAAPADRARVISVRLGRRSPRVLARLREYPDGARASVCAAPLGPDDLFRHDPGAVVLPEMAEFFGAGWTGILQAATAGRLRWMNDRAAILVPSARRGRMRVELRALAAEDAGAGAEVSLRVNDTTDYMPHVLRAGVQRYEWSVPESVWQAGTNELLLRVQGERGSRTLGLVRLSLTLLQ